MTIILRLSRYFARYAGRLTLRFLLAFSGFVFELLKHWPVKIVLDKVLAPHVREPSRHLQGYTVFDQDTGLLFDCLARMGGDLGLEASLWLSANVASLLEIKAMVTPFLVPTLAFLGFPQRLPLPLLPRHPRPGAPSPATVDLNHWHLVPGD